jgi:Domain of unknown function (DUF4350)
MTGTTNRATGRRRLALAVAVLIGLGLLTALVTPATSRTFLDPDAATPGGTRALAELLRAQGATVERTTDVARALGSPAGTTVVVAYPEILPPSVLVELESAEADVVLLGVPAQAPSYLGVVPVATADVDKRSPECVLPAATEAGVALTGGVAYAVGPHPALDDLTPGVSCYPVDGGGTVVQVTTVTGHRHTLLGSAEFMTNDRLADDGNAALALNLVGSRPDIVWWLPTPKFTGTQPLTALLPDGVWPLLAALAVLVVALAAWRGRRLGPVVVEPLPVAVRASETTEGRAQIYERYRTRDQAAQHLRRRTQTLLVRRLGLPTASDADAVVAAAARVSGRREDELQRLLYGPAPLDDDSLVTLAQQLSTLEQEAGQR